MIDFRNKKLLCSTKGNISSINSSDNVFLIGDYDLGASYAYNLELLLETKDKEVFSTHIPFSGYDFQLFIGDFTNDKKSEIVIRGSFGGSGGFEVCTIYKCTKGKLIEIFNQNTFFENNKCSAKYKDNYKLSVICNKKKYTINLANKSKDYLDYIYDKNQKLNTNFYPTIDAPTSIYTIKEVYNCYYELLINQRIVGISNSDTLGIIQSKVNFLDSTITTVYRYLLLSSTLK